MANIAYVRVSTIEQHEDRQVEALERRGIDKWFMEKVSGKDTNRPELQAMLDFASEGDTIYIHDFSRLARSTADLLQLVETLQARGISLVSNKENIDTSTPTGKLMLTMIGAINEFERQNLLERQREGVAIAREKGTYTTHRKGGKQRATIDPALFNALYADYRAGKVNVPDFAKQIGISEHQLYRRIRERKFVGDGYEPNVPLNMQESE